MEIAALPSSFTACLSSPLLLEWPGLNFETPGGPILFDEVGGDRSDAGRIDEEVVRTTREPLARHRPADHAINHDQRDVDARRPEMAGHRFGERALRHLALRERRRAGCAPPRGGRANDDDRPLPFAAHGGNCLLAAKKEAERVDPPGTLEILRLDLSHMAPDARAGVIDERIHVAEIGAHGGERRLD